MTSYHHFHLNLLKLGYNNLIKQPSFNQPDNYSPESEELLALFRECIELYEAHSPDAFETGQSLMVRLVRAYPQYTPLMARDLLWLFAGECIHYLADEEIIQFQQLDEARYEREQRNDEYDYLALRNSIIEAPTETKH